MNDLAYSLARAILEGSFIAVHGAADESALQEWQSRDFAQITSDGRTENEERQAGYANLVRGEIGRLGKYQAPFNLYQVLQAVDTLLDTSGRMDMPIERGDLVFATCSALDANASSMPVLGDRRKLIVFNDGLLVLNSLVAAEISNIVRDASQIAFAGGASRMTREALAESVARHSIGTRGLYQAMLTYVVLGNPRPYLDTARKQSYSRLQAAYFEGIFRWTVAHELGHVWLRHVDVNKPPVESPPGLPPEAEDMFVAHVREREADLYASVITFQSMFRRGFSTETAAHAVQSAPLVLRLTDAVVGVLATGEEQARTRSTSHPPSEWRFSWVSEELESWADANPAMANCADVLALGSELADMLDSEIRQYSMKGYAAGLRPHRLWGVAAEQLRQGEE